MNEEQMSPNVEVMLNAVRLTRINKIRLQMSKLVKKDGKPYRKLQREYDELVKGPAKTSRKLTEQELKQLKQDYYTGVTWKEDKKE